MMLVKSFPRLEKLENKTAGLFDVSCDCLIKLISTSFESNNFEFLNSLTYFLNLLCQDCFSIKSIDLSHNNIPFITKRMFPEDKYDYHDEHQYQNDQ